MTKRKNGIHEDAKKFLNSLPWIPSKRYIKLINELCNSDIFQRLDIFWNVCIEGGEYKESLK